MIGTLLRRRILLPVLLASLGVWLLIGCVYLPVPEHRDQGDPEPRQLLLDFGFLSRLRLVLARPPRVVVVPDLALQRLTNPLRRVEVDVLEKLGPSEDWPNPILD